MTKPERNLILQLRKWFSTSGGEDCDDRSLLQRFVAQRDEDAFAALVDRYGSLVLGVCRQVLGDEHAAEDAFQATFMILARKAASVRRHSALAAWLHRVAGNVARTARTSSARRRHHEQQAAVMVQPQLPEEPLDQTWRPILHEEIDHLPDRYRIPVILCYLHGKTNEEAARDLGWPVGTVKSSLARGREFLRRRLENRGLMVAAALLGADAVAAAVPPALARTTIQTAVAFAAGQAATSVVSESVALLVEGWMRSMAINKLKLAVTLCLTLAVLGTGAGVFYLQAQGDPQPKGNRDGSPAAADNPTAAGRPVPLLIQNANKTISSLAISPDGKTLASGGHDNIVFVFDLATGKKVREVSENGGIVSSVAFSPDGKTLAVGSQGSQIHLWDVPTGRELSKIQGSQSWDQPVAFSPDGKFLVTTGTSIPASNGRIYFRDVATGKELRRLSGHEREIGAVVFSPDGKILASCDSRSVRVWDTATGKLLHEWTDGICGSPNVLALSSDGKTLVQGGETPPVRILDVTTGKQLRTIDDLSMVASMALSPDGKLLVTASGYPKLVLQVWEMATSAELRRVTDLPSEWSRVAFASDGKLAYGSGGDITVLAEDGISLAQERLPAPSDLSPRELEALWTNLASTDGKRAFQALGKLRAAPKLTVALLKQHLRPVAAPDPEQVARLIADLDSDQSSVRDRASLELGQMGGAARPFLEKTLGGMPSAEVRRRAEVLLSRLEGTSPQTLRILRAMQLLECLGTQEPQRLLEGLAQGSADDVVTAEAKAALRRLAQRASTPATD